MVVPCSRTQARGMGQRWTKQKLSSAAQWDWVPPLHPSAPARHQLASSCRPRPTPTQPCHCHQPPPTHLVLLPQRLHAALLAQVPQLGLAVVAAAHHQRRASPQRTAAAEEQGGAGRARAGEAVSMHDSVPQSCMVHHSCTMHRCAPSSTPNPRPHCPPVDDVLVLPHLLHLLAGHRVPHPHLRAGR